MAPAPPLPPATATTYEFSPTRQDQGNPTASAANSSYAGHKFNNENLKAAVNEWRNDRTATEKTYGDLSKWDTSEVTDMNKMFRGASKFNGDLSKWDTSKVTNMAALFCGVFKFNGDLSKWDTSKVTDMHRMFDGASKMSHFHKPPGAACCSIM